MQALLIHANHNRPISSNVRLLHAAQGIQPYAYRTAYALVANTSVPAAHVQ